jgi:hypothetical protein
MTPSDKEVKTIKNLSVKRRSHTNYKENPKWVETAKEFTPRGVVVTHFLEIGRLTTTRHVFYAFFDPSSQQIVVYFSQSPNAMNTDVVIAIIGFIEQFQALHIGST